MTRFSGIIYCNGKRLPRDCSYALSARTTEGELLSPLRLENFDGPLPYHEALRERAARCGIDTLPDSELVEIFKHPTFLPTEAPVAGETVAHEGPEYAVEAPDTGVGRVRFCLTVQESTKVVEAEDVAKSDMGDVPGFALHFNDPELPG